MAEETFVKLREISPDVPVVLVSGYSEKQIRKRIQGLGFREILKKPIDIDDLFDKLRGIIGRARVVDRSPQPPAFPPPRKK